MQIKSRLLLQALPASILFLFIFVTSNLGFSLPASLMFSATDTAQSSTPAMPEPLVLTDQQSEYPLGLHLQILEDPGGQLTIDQVSSPEYGSLFTPSQVAVPNYGFTKSAYWVRYSLENTSQQVDEWLLEEGFANMQYVDLYSPVLGQSGYKVKETGSLRPVSTRDVLNPNIVFKLSVPTQSQQMYYMRFQNGASMTLPLTLYTPDAFSIQTQRLQMIYWVFFGAIFALLVYHLFLLFSLRDTSYLFFVILLASVLTTILSYSGFLETYIFTNIYPYEGIYFPWSFILLITSMVLFSDSFLELKFRLPKLHRINLVAYASCGILIVLNLIVSYHSFAVIAVIWAIALLISAAVAGFFSILQGFHPARFLLIAWFGMLICFILLFLVRVGIVPSTIFTENIYLLGVVWMAVCWSIALADRINLLKAETENANRELKSSEHRLSQILNGLPLGVLLYGKDQKPKYGNQRVYDIFNDPSGNVQVDPEGGRTLAQAIPYFSLRQAGTDQDYQVDDFPISNALRGKFASAEDIELNRGDKRVVLEVQASPVLGASGEVESAVVAVQDITQRKRAEAELDEYRKQLEMLVEKKTKELSATNEQLINEATERKELELALQQRINWLSMINDVHQTLAGETNLKTTYEVLSSKILELLEANLVFIVRWDNGSEPLDVFIYTLEDDITPDPQILITVAQKESPLRQDIELGKRITWFADLPASSAEPLAGYFQEHNIQSALLVPMMIHQSVAGIFCVAWPDILKGIIPHQLDLIERMAYDLADMAQDATLLDQNKALITAEERNRLARELHDSVTQTLFTASILAEATPRIWDKDQGIARQNMDKLSVLIRGALAEMRSMLIELRAGDLHKQSLDQLLIMLVEAARARTNTVITITKMDVADLPSNTVMVFYRIAREALNNTIVHAAASEIKISLFAESGQVELHIQDDGYGFNPEAVGEGHLGIRIMHERAKMIGGKVEIVSETGKGTEIIVSWSDNEGGTVEHD